MDDSDQCKEVYAWVGLALFEAQLLEHAVVNLFVTLTARGLMRPVPPAEMDELFANAFRKTLGQSIWALNGVLDSSQHIEVDDFEVALQERNFLAHGFFRHHAEDFVSSSGRRAMLERLQGMRIAFTDSESRLAMSLRELFSSLGVSEQDIISEYEELLRKAGTS